MQKLSEYYIAEVVSSHLHLCRRVTPRLYRHVPLAAGTPDVDNDPVALYLGYYDLSSS
jgi:hypothetical protein